MARRRVRWRNVARVACLVGAGALFATNPREPRPVAPAPVLPPRPDAPLPPEMRRLPRLRDIPRLVVPQPRKRRSSKGGHSDERRRAWSLTPEYPAKSTKGPRRPGPPRPSPQPGAVGEPTSEERSAPPPERSPPAAQPPPTGEFTPDPGP